MVRAVLPEGVTLALFEHPENAPLSLPETMAAPPAQTDTAEYKVACDPVLVCIDEAWGADAIRYTVRHELFHAIQASYPNVAEDRIDKRHSELTYWLVEGTAAAAERSSFVLARALDFNLRQATTPITSTAALHEYEAQDFWIFTGMEGNQSDHYLSYLKEIFDQGATPEHVDLEMDVGEAYWEWAKNQVMEHYQPMVGAFESGPCELEDAAIDPAGAKRYVLVANFSLIESFTYAVEVD